MKKQDIKMLTCNDLGTINEEVLRHTIQKLNDEGKRVTSINMDFSAGIVCLLFDTEV